MHPLHQRTQLPSSDLHACAAATVVLQALLHTVSCTLYPVCKAMYHVTYHLFANSEVFTSPLDLSKHAILGVLRLNHLMQACDEEKLLGHLGVVLYEYLGEEYPEVLGSILGALKAIVNVIGMTKMTPPIKDLLPRLTPILKNRHEKVCMLGGANLHRKTIAALRLLCSCILSYFVMYTRPACNRHCSLRVAVLHTLNLTL